MIELTRERVELLSKLYNLRGDDSVTILKIKDEIKDLSEKKENTILEINEQERAKTTLESRLERFIRETELFTENFKSFNNDTFAMLKEIGIELEVGTILEKISTQTPDYEKQQTNLIQETKGIIEDKKKVAEDIQYNLEVANTNLEDAEDSRKALNDLLVNIIEQGNADSYNRAFIKSKLEKLNYFNTDEISTLELLILFPEQGLSEFDKKYKNGDITFDFKEEIKKEEVKFDDIIQPSIVEESSITVEEPVVEENTNVEEIPEVEVPDFVAVEETPVSIEEVQEQVEPNEEIKIEEQEPEVEEIVSPIIDQNFTEEEQEENDVNYLNNLNLEMEKFTPEALELIKESSEGIVISNYELLVKEIEINSTNDVLYKNISNYMYLTDENLKNKINLLRSKGINDKTIRDEITKENFTCTKEELSNRLSLLEKNGESVKESLSLLKSNLEVFYTNLDKLNQAGIPVDDKEKVNYRYILSTKAVDEDLEVLKNYLIMLRKTNGKLALNVLNKNAKELTLEIDSLLEADLEELINANPEILSQNTESVIKRVKYCLDNDIEIKSNSDTYMKYIYDVQVFNELIRNKDVNLDKIELPKVEDNNAYILESIKNKDMIEKLDNYYKNETISSKISFNNAEIEGKYKNIYNSLIEALKGVEVNKSDRILEIDDLKISMNKFERNLYEIIVMLHEKDEDIEDNREEAILVAALYNLSVPKEKIEKVISTCLHTDDELGGIA